MLDSLSFSADNMVFNTLALLLMTLVLRFIAWLALFVHAALKK